MGSLPTAMPFKFSAVISGRRIMCGTSAITSSLESLSRLSALNRRPTSGIADKYGIPVLRFNTSHSDQERNQAKHMKETFKEILHAMGAVNIWGDDYGAHNDYGLHAPGNIIHEAGTVRMGNDPKSSPLNKWSQAHDCKNLFCVDGGPFVSQADKNITWTILALSMRSSEYIVDQMKKNNI